MQSAQLDSTVAIQFGICGLAVCREQAAGIARNPASRHSIQRLELAVLVCLQVCCQSKGPITHTCRMTSAQALVALQEASFAAAVPDGPQEAMYIALKQAISAHSPAIVPPASRPLVLAGPFGSACRKGELLQWLLTEYGDRIAAPEMVTTKPRTDESEASSDFKVRLPSTHACMRNIHQMIGEPCT